jgi:peptidoglycan-associated lipoprotein
MFGRRLSVLLGGLVLVISAAPAAAQTPSSVRVVDRAPIRRWFRAPVTDVLMEVESGTTLEVLDKERGWFWVITPRDDHGTRRSGWIDARNVEVITEPAAGLTPESSQQVDAQTPPGVPSQASQAPSTANIPEDRVAISARRDDNASAGSSAAAATKAYRFEDVHFDRDGHSLRSEDMVMLRAAAAALKADPLLVVNIEGYACSLGTPEYNLALGARRANAVKNYLASEGVAPERLRTVSLGEEHAKHDNSHEETRRLNRRVALVQNVQP